MFALWTDDEEKYKIYFMNFMLPMSQKLTIKSKCLLTGMVVFLWNSC